MHRDVVMCVWLLLLLLKCSSMSCGNSTDLQRLKTSLTTGYDTTMRPIVNQTNALQVNVSFDLIYVSDVDEVQSKLSLSMLLFVHWYDEFLTWTPSDYGGITEVVFPIGEVWYPPLIVCNDFNAFGEVVNKWGTVRFTSTGYATMVPGNVYHTLCSISVMYFPFDNQTCDLVISAMGFHASEIDLFSPMSTVMQTAYKENGEWEITGTKAQSDSITASGTLYLNRRPMFMIINAILPILFMCVLGLLVFVLPVDAGERMSYIITVLLAIAVFLTIIGDNLPQTSSPMPLICVYLVLALTLSALMCLVTVLSLKIYFLDDEKSPMPSWCKTILTKLSCKKKSAQKSKTKIQPLSITDETLVDQKKQPLDVSEDEQPMNLTWKDLSYFIDRMSLLIFTFLIFLISAVMLGMLTNHP